MGYRPPSTGRKLDFAGGPHEGLEVTVDAAPLGLMLAITEMFGETRQRTVKESATELRDLLAKFATVLESWNVVDRGGEPVPATLEGLLSQDTDFVLAIVGAWVTDTMQADEELGKDSTAGGTSAELSLPMEPLSPSLPS